ncbi:MAG TPA: glutamate formimidoyltransferase [Bacteroidia bacterium]|nr:glutamate formimidoyltransferase [Bacteroidia bacterium]HRS58975.1 glutamate formimidoyltransferase [Bacteroidia bacterium]HRU67536.1 glutamate formimidoyltransferase [Bacteroidia bacterium]
MKQLIECVPNFSEGRDMNIIRQITDEIEKVEGVKLLDVDPGQATNRTVVTFVGEPEKVVEAAFQAVKKAKELIDMSKHKGAHPRFGATDVCPLVPVSGITMEETVRFARMLAEKIGNELDFPVYCYENAAFTEERRNLANVRSGEYEGLPEKLRNPEWKPDFGPSEFRPKTGAIAVGARDFLIAVNFNLNTTSTRRANAIAFDVREKGRQKMKDGKPLLDENGQEIWEPGTLKATKAIGWFIDEYGIAQVSMNITNISITPLHVAFDEVDEKARKRGVRVTGTEIVGLVPLKAIIEAGKHYLKKQQRSVGVSEAELIKIAIKSMGLDDLYPFKPEEKIIEYVIADKSKKKLIDMNLTAFAHETASESPAPGGGSISAYAGALGAALATMVANLSSHKRGWDDRWEEFSDWAEKGHRFVDELIELVDEDTNAFNKVMDAFQLPKTTDEERQIRNQAIQDATKYAMLVPYRVMEKSLASMEVIRAMAQYGNPNSASDAGVGALCALTAVKGAFLNVRINSAGLKDKTFVEEMLAKGKSMVEAAESLQNEILQLVETHL